MILTDAAAFAAAMGGAGRLAGLDLGTRTIGVAFCDAGWRIASPAALVRRTRLTADLAELGKLLTGGGAAGVVLGMPWNMDGSAGPRAQATRAFAREAQPRLALPFLLWDERLSTFVAHEAMADAGVANRRRRDRIDAAAAAVILQSAIDALGGP